MCLNEEVGRLNGGCAQGDFDQHGYHGIEIANDLESSPITEYLRVEVQLSKRMVKRSVHVGIQAVCSESVPGLKVLAGLELMKYMMSELMAEQCSQLDFV